MKEKYSKPVMVIERFEMTNSIARNCADFLDKRYLTNKSMWECAWDIGGGFTVFAQLPQCLIESNEWVTDTGDLICYNNPADGAHIFSS